MASAEKYDALVIGAGQAGVPLSRALAEAGWKTALIEREHIGGTCVNEGCTPTKTMVASARVAYLARRAADYGVKTGKITVDMARVRERKREMVNSWRGGSEKRIAATNGLDSFSGEAHFIDKHTVEVALSSGKKRTLTAERIFLNVGARPAVPDIAGIENVPVLNSTTIMELDSVPEHLIVVGGGYIGLEFGQMFRRFGSKVTIVQRGAYLLGREDNDVADEVAKIMREDGIDLRLNTSTVSVKQSGQNIRLTVKTPDGQRVISGSHLLVAVGRTPNTDSLNLAAAGVTVDKRGFVPVNERLETNVSGIYALGDMNGGPAFTHISYDDFRIIRTNVIEKGSATTKDRYVPYTVFIDPQLGRVGLTEAEAKAQKCKIRVAKMPMSYVARALEVDESRGLMKVIVDAESAQILGCAVLGIEGGEIMSALQLAMMGKLPYTVLKDATFAHPTLCEALNNLFGYFE